MGIVSGDGSEGELAALEVVGKRGAKRAVDTAAVACGGLRMMGGTGSTGVAVVGVGSSEVALDVGDELGAGWAAAVVMVDEGVVADTFSRGVLRREFDHATATLVTRARPIAPTHRPAIIFFRGGGREMRTVMPGSSDRREAAACTGARGSFSVTTGDAGGVSATSIGALGGGVENRFGTLRGPAW